MESLRAAGVMEVVVVTGFRGEEVTREAQLHRGRMRLHRVDNPRFREGAILSLWSARDFLDRAVLIMDADVLCPSWVFERLVSSPHPNGLLVDGKAADTGEEQMVFGRQGRAFQITKRPSEEIRATLDRWGESLGFLKLSREGALVLRGLLEASISTGKVTLEHEQIYPLLFEKVPVGGERVDGLPWMEIDTREDLERAEKEIFPLWQVPKCLNRRLSDRFLPWVTRLPVTPNQWSLIGLLLGLASLGCIAEGSLGMIFAGAFLFQLFYMVDNWDGDVARLRGLSSRLGSWLDLSVDAFVHSLLPLALSAGILRWAGEGAILVGVLEAGILAAVGVALDFAVTLWAKTRGFGPAVFADPARYFSSRSRSPAVRWLACNATQENFSLLVAGVLLLGLHAPFILATAVGSHFYWIYFLYGQRHRLGVAPPPPAAPLARFRNET